MSSRIVRGKEVEAVTEGWGDLWRGTAGARYFSHPDWIAPWWATLGRSTEPYVAVASSSESMTGVAPLSLYPTSFGRVLRPAGAGISDYTDWLLPETHAARQAVARDLVDVFVAQDDWVGVELSGWADENDARTLIDRLEWHGLSARLLPGLICPYVAMPDGFATYYRSRGSQARYNVRSRERRLRQFGPISYEHVSADDAPRVVEEAIALHARRWQGQRTSTVFSSSSLGRAFYRASIPVAIRNGLGDLAVLRVDDRAIASAVGFHQGHEYEYYLPAWHPGYHPYAPSSLLLVHLLEYAADRGATNFDFMLGDEPYKTAWATGHGRVHTVVAARSDAAGTLWLLRTLAYHALREHIRSSPRLMAFRRHGFSAVRDMVTGP